MKHYKLNKKKFAKFVVASMIMITLSAFVSSYFDICAHNLSEDSTYSLPWTTAFSELVASAAK